MTRFCTTLFLSLFLSTASWGQAATPTPAAPAPVQDRALHNDFYYWGKLLQTEQQATNAKLDAILQQLKAGGAPTTTPGTTPAPNVDAYFPPKPGDALFPSPENSRSARVGTEVQGRAYLLSKDGTTFQLTPNVPAGSAGLLINGKLQPSAYGDNYVQIIVRGGEVFCQASGGQWQHFDPSMGSFYNATLPDVASATPAPPPVPVLPTPYAVAPGSSGKVLSVGAGKPYATFVAAFAASADGDTIDCANGLIHEDVPELTKSLQVKSCRFDFAGVTLARGMGGLLCSRDCLFDGIEATGAGMTETEAGGTAAIRPNGPVYITVKNSKLTKNQNGIAGGGFGWALIVDNTVFDNNGLGDGRTHDIYASGGTVRITLNKMTALNPNGGHAVKTRALETFITNSNLAASDATIIDWSDGAATLSTVTGTKLSKPAGAGNHGIVGFGLESLKNGNAGVTISGGSIDALCDNPLIQGAAGSTITLDNVPRTGNKISAQGATVKGL